MSNYLSIDDPVLVFALAPFLILPAPSQQAKALRSASVSGKGSMRPRREIGRASCRERV